MFSLFCSSHLYVATILISFETRGGRGGGGAVFFYLLLSKDFRQKLSSKYQRPAFLRSKIRHITSGQQNYWLSLEKCHFRDTGKSLCFRRGKTVSSTSSTKLWEETSSGRCQKYSATQICGLNCPV